MIITHAVPLIVQLEGVRERSDAPCDTETRLYFEQQLDRGDALLQPLSEAYPEGFVSVSGATHRLISETGGVFHVRIAEGEHAWPVVGTPAALSGIVAMAAELTRMQQQISNLLLANQLLEAENARLALDKMSLKEELFLLQAELGPSEDQKP